MIRRIRDFFHRLKLDSAYREKIRSVEQLTGLKVSNAHLYLKALRHRSIVVEKNMPASESYEQLEFMGDAVLDLVASDIIFQKFPDASEGFMTRLRSKMVKGETLAMIAREIGLMEYIEMGDRVKNQGIEQTQSVLADAFEALVGAIYKDHDYEICFNFVSGLYNRHVIMEELVSVEDNYKSILLETVQSRKLKAPIYQVVRETGPGHEKVFEIEVFVNQKVLGKGTGKNKKKAEQEAARAALEQLNISD